MSDITSTRPASGAPIATAWGAEIHDAIEGIQSGRASLTFSSAIDSAVLAVTFPRAYAVAPAVVLSVETAITRGIAAKVVQGSITTTGFSVQGQNTAGASVSGSAPFGWIAIGTPA